MTPSKNENGTRLYLWIAGAAASVLALCLTVSAFLYTQNHAYCGEIKTDIQKSIEVRLRAIEEDIREIKTDLKARLK